MNDSKMDTRRVEYDARVKTFSLYPGSSQYAFYVNPEGRLEHLYWGNALSRKYDIRYLASSARQPHFETAELDEHSSGTWESSTTKGSDVASVCSQESEEKQRVNKLRYDNLKWRLMSKQMGPTAQEGGRVEVARMAYNLKGGLDNYLEKEKKETETETGTETASFKDVSTSLPKKTVRSDTSDRKPPTTLSEVYNYIGRRSSHSTSPLALAGVGSNGIPKSPIQERVHSKLNFEESNFTREQCYTTPSSPKRRTSLIVEDSDIAHATAHIAAHDVRLTSPCLPTFERKGGEIGKATTCLEYADIGTGDYRAPSFIVSSPSGTSISPIRYKSHKILEGKESMPDYLPGVRCTKTEATTLIVTLSDEQSGLEVDLYYVCLHNYNAICRRTVLRNLHNPAYESRGCCDQDPSIDGILPKTIQRAYSATIDFEASNSPFYVTQLAGSWARERQVVETKLTQGTLTFGSARGVSSHQQNPFVCISHGPPHENQGDCSAFALLYSGNFVVEAELGEMGRLRVNMGINSLGFSWFLEPGGSFNSPECLIVRSSEGIGGISRTMHRITLENLIPKNWSDATPPIVLNSWEAKYFNVDHDSIIDLAVSALGVNANLIVLDDGWFGSRVDISSSIGDWNPNEKKFPGGLKKLADEINWFGLKFGIWVEPEMVSIESDLYKKHPDWCLSVPGQARQVGRRQLVLDLSRKCVRDHLYDVLHKLLSTANISYVKWDMNRPLTEVFSNGITDHKRMCGVCQGEVGHRYVLGLYELMSRLQSTFPDILFSHSASGGGRFDLGILYFSSEVWCSDNTDAMARMKIQYGTSLAYPARCIGAHVSACPNHITGNYTRAKTRAMVAMCGTFGFELNLLDIPHGEVILFRDATHVYTYLQSVIRCGDLYRLWNPFKSNFAAWMYVSRDKKKAAVFAFSLNSDHWSCLVPRLILQGLDLNTEYTIVEPFPNNICQQSGNLKLIETESLFYQLDKPIVRLSGRNLMEAGLPVRFYTLDDSVLFVLEAHMHVN